MTTSAAGLDGRVRTIGVVGAGYVGLVTAACLADSGSAVTIIEIDPARLSALRAGRAPFHEPGLQELLDTAFRAARLHPTGDPGELGGCDVVMVCVGTPRDHDGEADVSQVVSACAMVAAHAPDAVVVIRSTLPIGTAGQLEAWLGRVSLERVVLNPEFLRQGSAIADFRSPTRLVLGTQDGQPTDASRLVTRLLGTAAPVIVTDYATAEMIKNAANAFLATRLSFINEVADLCEAYGADIDAVRAGIGLDPRIGTSYLQPGIGFGGSCLPKELSNLTRLGIRRGVPLHLLDAASRGNGNRAIRVAGRLDRLAGGLAGRRVGFLGLAFKPNTDDLRNSPALALAEALIARGAVVIAHDPAVPLARTARIKGLRRATTAARAIRGADLVVLATDWAEYGRLDWSALRRTVRQAMLFDGRNALDPADLRKTGWRVARIGEQTHPSAVGEPAA